jgi:hypothetical protein
MPRYLTSPLKPSRHIDAVLALDPGSLILSPECIPPSNSLAEWSESTSSCAKARTPELVDAFSTLDKLAPERRIHLHVAIAARFNPFR